MDDSRFLRAVRTVLHQQARAVRAFVTGPSILAGQKVDLSAWHDAMVTAIRPHMLEEFKMGMAVALRKLHAQGLDSDINVRELRARMHAKLNEEVERLIKETNDAYTDKLNDKIREIRRRMRKEGISGMAAKREFTNFVYADVVTMERALRIVETEQVSMLEGGKLLVNQESGQMNFKQWIADGPNPCDKCKALHLKVVPIDEPFWVDPKGGAYAIKDKSPMHPRCFCRVIYLAMRPKVPKKKKSWSDELTDELCNEMAGFSPACVF